MRRRRRLGCLRRVVVRWEKRIRDEMIWDDEI